MLLLLYVHGEKDFSQNDLVKVYRVDLRVSFESSILLFSVAKLIFLLKRTIPKLLLFFQTLRSFVKNKRFEIFLTEKCKKDLTMCLHKRNVDIVKSIAQFS